MRACVCVVAAADGCIDQESTTEVPMATEGLDAQIQALLEALSLPVNQDESSHVALQVIAMIRHVLVGMFSHRLSARAAMHPGAERTVLGNGGARSHKPPKNRH